jgi:hypothetical protein
LLFESVAFGHRVRIAALPSPIKQQKAGQLARRHCLGSPDGPTRLCHIVSETGGLFFGQRVDHPTRDADVMQFAVRQVRQFLECRPVCLAAKTLRFEPLNNRPEKTGLHKAGAMILDVVYTCHFTVSFHWKPGRIPRILMCPHFALDMRPEAVPHKTPKKKPAMRSAHSFADIPCKKG